MACAWHVQVRLFGMLLYSSCTSRFAILRTPRGLGELVRRGALTASERDALLQSSMGHNAVLAWISTLLNSALSDGRLCGSPTGGSPVALQVALQAKLTELRMSMASIEDELTGRMPLAYTQLVQLMNDLLMAFTPFALVHSVGGVGAVLGTALVTLFHASLLNLAKMFLDPLNNDDYSRGIGINVATLLQETNVGSNRWRKAADWVPDAVLPLGSARSSIDSGTDAEGGTTDAERVSRLGARTGTGDLSDLSGRVVSSRDPAERPAENVPAQWRGPSSGSRRRAMLQEVAIQQQLQELKDSDAPYRLRPPRPEAEADPPSG